MTPLGGKKIVAQRVSELLKKEFPPNPSFIEPYLLSKGGTLLLGGEAKCGKSFVMLEACRALTTGTPFMGNPEFTIPEPVTTLYIEAENGERSCKERLSYVMRDETESVWKDRLWYVSKELNLQLDTRSGLEYIYSMVRDVKPNVLILDPISFLYHKDENSNTDIGNLFLILGKLKEIGAEQNLSIIFAHHFGKPPYSQEAKKDFDYLSSYNFRGASKWKDGGDTVITMHRYKELDREYEAWKLRMRFVTRHGSSPPESIYTVNDKEDLRVRWEEHIRKLPKLKVIKVEPTAKLKQENFSFKDALFSFEEGHVNKTSSYGDDE